MLINAESFGCYQWLPAVLQKYRGRYPLVEFRLVTLRIENVAHALMNKRIDVAILTQAGRNATFS
jgi:DNA-binding transcriptional LysR family regulator